MSDNWLINDLIELPEFFKDTIAQQLRWKAQGLDEHEILKRCLNQSKTNYTEVED